MTKKDFILIADTLKKAFEHSKPELTEEQKIWIVECFVSALNNENPRFDELKFKNRIYINK